MGALRFILAVSLSLASVAGCSSRPPVLPDRASPEVRAEEARVAALLGSETSVVGARSACEVRLLRQEAEASFVWATCEAVDPPHGGMSAPMRVSGSDITVAADGAAFPQSLREMFPEDLADFVLSNPDSLEMRP
jgi:hypothetical protein